MELIGACMLDSPFMKSSLLALIFAFSQNEAMADTQREDIEELEEFDDEFENVQDELDDLQEEKIGKELYDYQKADLEQILLQVEVVSPLDLEVTILILLLLLVINFRTNLVIHFLVQSKPRIMVPIILNLSGMILRIGQKMDLLVKWTLDDTT